MPDSCKKIQERAFYRCMGLKTVTNVKLIGKGAFYKTKLKNVTKDGKIKRQEVDKDNICYQIVTVQILSKHI